MDTTTAIFAWIWALLMWCLTLTVAWKLGWNACLDKLEDERRWSRWLIRNEYNRRTKL